MTTREQTEGIADIIVHQCLTETHASQIQVLGLCDWDPWDNASKLAFLEELERQGKIHRVMHPGKRTPGGWRVGPGPKA
jgi:hypothetical protein